MKSAKFQPKVFLIALSFFTASACLSCSTGTDSGQTNVEDSGAKDVHEKSGHEKGGKGTDDNQPGADG